jgi:hypothetical protein
MTGLVPRELAATRGLRNFKLRYVTCLAAGPVEIERKAVEVGFEWILSRNLHADARALASAASWAPATETWARTTVLSKDGARRAVWLCATDTANALVPIRRGFLRHRDQPFFARYAVIRSNTGLGISQISTLGIPATSSFCRAPALAAGCVVAWAVS